MKFFKITGFKLGVLAMLLVPAVAVVACTNSAQPRKEEDFTQNDQKDVKKILDQFVDTTTFLKELRPSDFVEQNPENITCEILKIKNPIQDNLGTTITLKVVGHDDETGKIKLQIIVVKNQATNSNVIEINGFQTTDEWHKNLWE